MRSRAKSAPTPATEPTATPATAPLLKPEPLLVVADEVSAAAVASDWPTVTVWACPATVWTATAPSPEVVVVVSEVSDEVPVCRGSACAFD